MLAASLVVPKDGSSPFHPSASDPMADMAPTSPQEAANRVAFQPRRINARGCVVTVHSAINGAPSPPLPRQPSDEAPGWWDRLARRYFPSFEQIPAFTFGTSEGNGNEHRHQVSALTRHRDRHGEAAVECFAGAASCSFMLILLPGGNTASSKELKILVPHRLSGVPYPRSGEEEEQEANVATTCVKPRARSDLGRLSRRSPNILLSKSWRTLRESRRSLREADARVVEIYVSAFARFLRTRR